MQSCTAVPAFTDYSIDEKINSARIGAAKEEIFRSFGQPHYFAIIPREQDTIEIWIYDLGNYWIHQGAALFFQNNRLVGTSRHPYRVLEIMRSLNILGKEAKLYSADKAEAVFANEKTTETHGLSFKERMALAAQV